MEALLNPVVFLSFFIFLVLLALVGRASFPRNYRKPKQQKNSIKKADHKPIPYKPRPVLDDLEAGYNSLAATRLRLISSNIPEREIYASRIDQMLTWLTDISYSLSDPGQLRITKEEQEPIEEYPTYLRNTNIPSDKDLLRMLATKHQSSRAYPNSQQY